MTKPSTIAAIVWQLDDLISVTAQTTRLEVVLDARHDAITLDDVRRELDDERCAYVIMFGVDSQKYGSLNLPLDLGPILGMTGCDLRVAPLVTLPVPPFGLGSRFLSAKIPRPATGTAFSLFAQVLHTGPGPAGLYTTQVISFVLGDSESVNTVSSSTTFTGTAQYGPAVGYSSGQVLLLR